MVTRYAAYPLDPESTYDMSKRDRAWLEIDLGAIIHNFHVIEERVGGHTTVMPVVKADAYGHGAVPVAQELEKAGAGWFGLATVDEALELRGAGVRGRMLILGCSAPQRAKEIVAADLTPTIMTPVDALAFAAAAGDRPLPVHIKVDTGMCRMGVRHDQIADFCQQVRDLHNLDFEGIFSHFADAGLDPEFSALQIDNFRQAVAVAEQILGPFKWQHMAASAALLLYHDKPFNMVRPGISLYGAVEAVTGDQRPPLKQPMTLKARLALVKRVVPGDKIGYGCTYEVKQLQHIGIVPVGYADGYSRHLSNNADVIIRGRRRPVLGRVSMDVTVVSLGQEADCEPGDEVVLMGRQGEEQITVDELARRAGTIPEEVFSCMGKRLPRIYQE